MWFLENILMARISSKIHLELMVRLKKGHIHKNLIQNGEP